MLFGYNARPGSRFPTGLVATPEQEQETRRLTQMFGQGQQLPVPADAPDMSMQGIAGGGSGLMGSGNPRVSVANFDIPTQRASQTAGNMATPSPAATMSRGGAGQEILMRGEWENTLPTMTQQPQRPQRAPWEQSKRDKWAQALAAIGTSFGAIQASMDGDHVGSSRMMQNLRDSFMQQRQRSQLGQSLRAQGYGDDQIMIALNDPEAFKRQQDWEDWKRRKEWEAANRPAANNDTQADYQLIASRLGEEAANNYLRNKTDPVVNIPLGGGQTYFGPRSAIPGTFGAQQGAPPGIPTVSDQAGYDALAPGAQYRDPTGNLRTKGGGAGNGVGGFRSDVPSGSPLDPWRR